MDRVQSAVSKAQECLRAADEIRRKADVLARGPEPALASQLETVALRWLAVACRTLAKQWAHIPRL